MNSSSSTVPSPSTSKSPNMRAAFSPAFIWTVITQKDSRRDCNNCTTDGGLTLTSSNTQSYQCFVPLILPPFHTRFQLFLTSLSTRWFLNSGACLNKCVHRFRSVIEFECFFRGNDKTITELHSVTSVLLLFSYLPSIYNIFNLIVLFEVLLRVAAPGVKEADQVLVLQASLNEFLLVQFSVRVYVESSVFSNWLINWFRF